MGLCYAYGGDDAGAVGANHAGLVLGLEHVGDADHVWQSQCGAPPFRCVCAAVPCWGMPSVMLRRVSSCVGRGQVCVHTYVTIRGTSALMASSMPAAATGGLLGCQTVYSCVWCGRAYGTKMAVAVAPVSLMPCSTLAKTGRPRCSWPAFLGLVPPTTFVPARPRQLLLSLRPDGCAIRMVAYRTRWPAVRGSCRRISTAPVSVAAAARSRRGALHSRSLLAGEALEQHLGVAVDAQVLDGLGVLRRARCVRPGRGLGERRAHGLSDGLHGVDCSCWM